jgi:hypothetical protein
LSDFELIDIANHDAAQEIGCVGTLHLVLEERRHVDHSGRMPKREVLPVRVGVV